MSSTAPQLLVDTSVWIGLQQRELPKDLGTRLTSLVSAGLVSTNEVVRVEMLVGSRTPREYAINDQRFRGLVQLPIAPSTWEEAADLGYALRRSGITVGLPDLLIATTAIRHSVVLVHADKGFDLIASHSRLQVESYAAP